MLKAAFRVATPEWQAVVKMHKEALVTALDTAFAAIELPAKKYAVSLSFVADAEIQTLNRDYRQKDKPTNVLSFPQIADFDSLAALPQPVELGDIVLAYETCAAEATAQGKSLADHTAHLLVHGFLHLLGYDHLTEDDAANMEELETDILRQLGIADPY